MLKVISEKAWNVLVDKAQRQIGSVPISDDPRRDACPLYHLIFYPNVKYDVYDQFGRTIIPQMPFVDRVLQTMFDICTRRVGHELQQDPLIARVFKLCISSQVNVRTKQLFVILLLCLDQGCLDLFKTLFPGGQGCPELIRFNRHFPRINVEVQAVLNSTLGPFQVLRAREYILDDVVLPACF